jgi:hypothetical protein
MTGATMSGGVDQLLRPLLRLKIGTADDELLTMIDTGFNGQLLMTTGQASRFGIHAGDVLDIVTLADGSEALVYNCAVPIEWFGRTRMVTAFVSPAPSDAPHGDAPLALLGNRLIAPDCLEIHFGRQTVTLRQEA